VQSEYACVVFVLSLVAGNDSGTVASLCKWHVFTCSCGLPDTFEMKCRFLNEYIIQECRTPTSEIQVHVI